MFQFGRFPSCNYWFITGFTILHREGFPIRTPTDRGLFTAPRGFSQLVASFFGSWCQGIRPMLFIAWTFSSFLVLSCLSFANNCSVIKYCFAIYEKAFSFDCACHLLCGKIVVNTTFFGKTNFSFLIYLFFLLNYLFVSFIRYSVFNDHCL